MYIKKIKLDNFRNYSNLELEISPNINIFFGNNGEGKTNILEAIYISSITKSYKTTKDKEIIKLNEDYTHIELDYVDNFKKTLIKNNVKVYINNNTKKIKENDVDIKRYSDYIGKYNVVMFSPESMEIIKGSPKNRRNFLNILISQISKKYLISIQEYNKTLTIKNNILKTNKKEVDLMYLDILDEKLSTLIEYITFERKKILNKILEKADKIQNELTGGLEKINIKYISEFENLKKDQILNIIKKSRDIDFIRKMSSKGIQRDDIEISINDKNISLYGSQGQCRTVLLALKISEVEILKNEKETTPIILLDDVFSELDSSRINYLLEYIKDYQVVITTNDISNIKKQKNITFFEVINKSALQIEK